MSVLSRHPTKRYYFADYEVLVAGRAMFWGNSTLVYALADPEDFDPAKLAADITARAAGEHGVERTAVRIRNLCRL